MTKTNGDGRFIKPEGYPEGLHYLWHLDMIGLLGSPYWLRPGNKPDDAPGNWMSVRKNTKEQPIKIAIIDNGMAKEHPNLKGRSEDRIEFVQSPWGTRYVGAQEQKDECGKDGRETEGGGAGTPADQSEDTNNPQGNRPGYFDFKPYLGGADRSREISKDLADAIKAMLNGQWEPKELARVQDPSHRFGAHGTACAGLVAASAEIDEKNPHAIRYSGASPLAHVIPITTSYTAEYWPLIMALIYAMRQGADVILLPLSIEEMKEPTSPCPPGARAQKYDEDLRDAPDAIEDPRFSRLMVSRTRLAEKQLFEALLGAISSLVPVIVPAGNSGPRGLEYPATIRGLIVVGACTAYGRVSSYSSRPVDGHEGITVYAPSDDREEISETEFRVAAGGKRDLRLPSPQTPKERENEYCPYGVLTTDIPGYWGYTTMDGPIRDLDAPANPNPPDDSKDLKKQLQNQPAALYTVFGGTSAAASIVAGVVAQMVAWGKTPGGMQPSGVNIHRALTDTATAPPCMTTEGPVEGGDKELRFLDAHAAIEHIAMNGSAKKLTPRPNRGR